MASLPSSFYFVFFVFFVVSCSSWRSFFVALDDVCFGLGMPHAMDCLLVAGVVAATGAITIFFVIWMASAKNANCVPLKSASSARLSRSYRLKFLAIAGNALKSASKNKRNGIGIRRTSAKTAHERRVNRRRPFEETRGRRQQETGLAGLRRSSLLGTALPWLSRQLQRPARS